MILVENVAGPKRASVHSSIPPMSPLVVDLSASAGKGAQPPQAHVGSPVGDGHRQGQQGVQMEASSFPVDLSAAAFGGANAGVLVFLSANNSEVRAHAGTTVVLPCKVHTESQFGMVSEMRPT